MSTDSFDPSASISASQPSFIEAPSNGSDELDSLPDSEPDSDEVTVSEDEEESDAEREWKENLQQLEMMLSMVVVPYMGKYFGRKFAYWGELYKPFAKAVKGLTRWTLLGWKQFMEWKYPVEIVITNKARFKGMGAIEAAASL